MSVEGESFQWSVEMLSFAATIGGAIYQDEEAWFYKRWGETPITRGYAYMALLNSIPTEPIDGLDEA